MENIKTLYLLLLVLTLVLWPVIVTAQGDQEIRQVQGRLKDAGFDPGPIDGIWGLQTQRALSQYQAANGLRESGILDTDTQNLLGVKISRDNDMELYFKRAYAYASKAQHDLAISEYTKFIEINSYHPDVYNNRGQSYAAMNQYDLAISDFNNSIKLNPKAAITYYNRANIYTAKEMHQQAISDYTKALEINPEFGEAYWNRGYLYTAYLNSSEKGCSDWKKACELGKCRRYFVRSGVDTVTHVCLN